MFTIYQVTNTINGKCYVGYNSHFNERKRFNEHSQSAKRGSVLPLHAAIRKYGKKNFSLSILETGENEEYGLKVAEPMYIAWLKPEYNICSGGEGTPGRVWSEESRRKSSAKQKGRKLTEEHKEALRGPRPHMRKEKPPKRTKEDSNKLRSESHKKFLREHPLELNRIRTFQVGIKKPTISCPHCSKVGGNGTMKRWHFDRCRKRVV